MNRVTLEEWAGLAGGIATTVVFGAAVVIWVNQILAFLKTGSWQPAPVTEALYWLTDIEWFIAPDTWLGVHRILSGLNSGIALILAALLAMTLIAMIANDLLRRKTPEAH